jgi:hypothetical protein
MNFRAEKSTYLDIGTFVENYCSQAIQSGQQVGWLVCQPWNPATFDASSSQLLFYHYYVTRINYGSSTNPRTYQLCTKRFARTL